MSTTTSPPQQQPLPRPLPGARVADQAIDRQLNKTRREVKIIDLFSSLMVLAAGVLAFLLLAALIDHWILPLAGWARWLLLMALLAGSLGYFALAILPLLLGRINPLYAARAIEQSQPSLKNSLINYLLFRQDRAGLRSGVYEALKQRAATDLSHVQPDTAVDRSRLIHIGYGLIAVLVLFAAYTIISPKSPLQTAQRVAAPWADIARPTRVRIEEVEPGSREMFYGERIAVSATCYDLYQDEPVTLVYSSLDGRITQQTVRMQAGPGGLRFEAQLPPEDAGVQQDLIYHIQAGDAVTASYRLSVLPAPTLLVQQVEYEFPAYTRQPPRVAERQADIKALEGTRVTVRGVANQPIRWATVQLHGPAGEAASGDGAAEAPPENVSMSADGQQARGSFVLQLDAAGRRPKHAAYQLRFETSDGHQNPRAPLHRIEVTRDLTPEIEILTPTAERIELPLDRSQKIEVRAIDPDYGLRTISLRAVAGGTELLAEDLLDEPAGHTGQFIASSDFKPWQHGLNPGDTLMFWATAADNRVSPQTGEPDPNLAKTKTYHVTILPPENPPADPDAPAEDPEAAVEAQPQPGAEQSPAGAEQPEDAAGADSSEQPQDGGAGQDAGEQGGQQGEAAGAGQQAGDGSASAGSAGQQQGGAGQSSGGAGGDSASPTPDAAGGASGSPTGGSSTGGDRSGEGSQPGDPEGGQAGSAGGQGGGSPSEPGEPAGGQPPSDGAATATGQQATGDEPLHDGEVIEKTLEYMRSQDRDPSATREGPTPADDGGQTAGDQPQQSESGDPQSATGEARPQQAGDAAGEPTPAGTAAPEPGAQPSPASQEPQQAQSGEQASGGGQQQPDRSQGAGQQRDGSGGEGGKPQGPAETRPEEAPAGAESGQPRQGGLGDTGDSGRGQASEDPSGSAEAQGPNRDLEKIGEGDDPQPQPSDGAQSPSQSKRQRDLLGGEGGDQSGEGSKGAGQGAAQEGHDSPGSQSSADDGAGASQESGAGDTAPRPGSRQQADQPTGSPGTQPGPGSSTQRDGGTSGAGGQSPDGPESPASPSGRAASKAENDRGQGAPVGGGRPGAADPGSGGQLGELSPADEPNLEYARRSTEMVLEYLRDQQQKPDPELLEQLGWNEDDLRQFLQRWEAMRAASSQDQQARRELNDALRSLGLRPGSTAARRAAGRADTLQGLREDGRQSRPPLPYLEQFNAYKKGTARVDE